MSLRGIHHRIGRLGIGRLAAVFVLAGSGALALSGCEGTAAAGPTPAGMPIAGYGYTCKAGFYTCKLPTRVPLGGPCSCPGIGAASYGNVFQP